MTYDVYDAKLRYIIISVVPSWPTRDFSGLTFLTDAPAASRLSRNGLFFFSSEHICLQTNISDNHSLRSRRETVRSIARNDCVHDDE